MTHTLFIIQMYKNQKENSITLLVLMSKSICQFSSTIIVH